MDENSFLSFDELKSIGFKSFGTNVLISRKVSFYNPAMISIGNNVRIDDFCILSGNIKIGNNVHISAGCFLFGGKSGIEMKDFSGVSSRSAIYAESDDYSGLALTNPTISEKYRRVSFGKVIFEKHVLVGTGSTILPGVTLGEGVAVGSMSLVNKSLESWGIYVGIPCKRIKERSKNILKLESKMRKENEL